MKEARLILTAFIVCYLSFSCKQNKVPADDIESLYKQYNREDFEIIGISLDTDKE